MSPDALRRKRSAPPVVGLTIPIGTVQWRVFNAKKKLAPHLKQIETNVTRMAA